MIDDADFFPANCLFLYVLVRLLTEHPVFAVQLKRHIHLMGDLEKYTTVTSHGERRRKAHHLSSSTAS